MRNPNPYRPAGTGFWLPYLVAVAAMVAVTLAAVMITGGS